MSSPQKTALASPRCLRSAPPMLLILACSIPLLPAQDGGTPDVRPNVLMVLVDDMGMGDLSMAGNEDVSTPHLDAMASRSARLTSFYVSPVCGMTRAALMSGRYPHRVGVHVNGRNLDRGTPTIASELKAAGYATGIFGKWHLGDHYPNRPVDFGFEKSVVSRGGIIGQLAPEPNPARYSDPYLMHDGTLESFEGYATDVHFEQALSWMEKVHAGGRPFFAFLSTNAPHKPYNDVPEQGYLRLLAELEAKARLELEAGQSLDHDKLDAKARYYAMVERIDENMGRLFDRLGKNGLLNDTLVLFFSDNGPVPGLFSAGYRGGKGMVYEGGIKTHFFAHWPGKLEPDFESDRIAAHIDLMPTILDLCSVKLEHSVDGVSLWPLLSGSQDAHEERLLFFEARQGKGSARQNFAVRSQDHKLVMPGGYAKPKGGAQLALYDMRKDPTERHDLSASLPGELERLSQAYDSMADELKLISQSKKRSEPRIEVGALSDHPQILSRAHWKRTDSASLAATFQLIVTDPGTYSMRVRFAPDAKQREASLLLNNSAMEQVLPADATEVLFGGLQLQRGVNSFTSDVSDARGHLTPAWQVVLTRTGELEVPARTRPRDRSDRGKRQKR